MASLSLVRLNCCLLTFQSRSLITVLLKAKVPVDWIWVILSASAANCLKDHLLPVKLVRTLHTACVERGNDMFTVYIVLETSYLLNHLLTGLSERTRALEIFILHSNFKQNSNSAKTCWNFVAKSVVHTKV